MKTLIIVGVALATAAGSCLAEGRPGRIEWSDGEVLAGDLSLSPGRKLRIHRGKELVAVELARVIELRFAPEKELMERQWRFVEVGQTEKEFTGKPYPTRHVGVTARLSDGETLRGHLYTTVLYVEGEKTEKVVFRAKQRGQQGQSLVDLVYPVRVVFSNAVTSVDAEAIITMVNPDARHGSMVGLTYGALARLEARPTPDGSAFVFPPLYGAALFLSVRVGDTIYVGWPADPEPETEAVVQNAIKHVRDFFDRVDLLAVHTDTETKDIYTLVMLRREGKTTLGARQSQPWRLGIWRWREADGKVMVAGRGYFCRGIVSKRAMTDNADGVPRVALTARLWRVVPGASAAIDLEVTE